MKSFEERLERLEELNEKIGEGNIPLEEAVSLFEEGISLARGLEKELSKVERKIEILVDEGAAQDGRPDGESENAGKPKLELFPELDETD